MVQFVKTLVTTIRGWCVIFGILVTVLFLNAAVQVWNPEWAKYNRDIVESFVTSTRVDRCVTCHVDATSHPEPHLLDHPPERFGCTLCHRGIGRAVTSRDAHAKGHPEVGLQVGEDVQSSCVSCHLQQFRLEHAPIVNEGKRLLYEKRCIRCHQIASFSAAYPGLEKFYAAGNLGRIASGMPAEWMYRFVRNPHAVAARTGMPYYSFSHEDARAIIQYLVANRERGIPKNFSQSKFRAASPGGGRVLVESLGCLSCHALDGKGSPPAVEGSLDLSYMGSFFGPAFLFSWLYPLNSGHSPAIPLAESEAYELAAYLSTLKAPAEKEYPVELEAGDFVVRGRSLIQENNCYACHTIPGFENVPPALPELSTIGDKVIEDKAGKKAYFISRIRNPRSQGPSMKMPVIAMTEGEAAAIAVVLMGLKADAVPPHLISDIEESEKTIQDADRMAVDQFKCASCHRLPWRITDDVPRVTAPDLAAAAEKLSISMLAATLSEPHKQKPNSARMPSYQLQDHEVLTLIRAIRLR